MWKTFMGYGVVKSDKTGTRIGNSIIFCYWNYIEWMHAGYFRTPQWGLFITLIFVVDGLKCPESPHALFKTENIGYERSCFYPRSGIYRVMYSLQGRLIRDLSFTYLYRTYFTEYFFKKGAK